MSMTRSRFVARLCLGVALLACLASAQAARVALVIGNDAYRHISALRNAKADARAMAGELERSGFSVTLALDQDRAGMNGALRDFEARIRGGDQAVVFYAGHAVELAGTNYLLPIDIRGDNDRQIQDDALPLQRLAEGIADQRPGFSLLVIDACRDNPFKGQGRNLATRGLAPAPASAGQMIVYSAGAGQKALDRLNDSDPVPNSVFTRVFLEEMAAPGVRVRDMVTNVRKRVFTLARQVNHEQLPALYDSALDDFYFRGEGTAAPRVSPPPRPDDRVAQADPAPSVTPVARQPDAPPVTPGTSAFRDCDECPEMVLIPAGEFTMGSRASEGRKEERPNRRVIVDTFALGRFEITQEQWVRFMGKNPSYAQRCGDTCPVERVSWDEVKMFLGKLNRRLVGREEGPYRLPTEAEWEYACRAGTDKEYCGSDTADYAGWYNENSERRVKPVGGKQPNDWGLHDMSGNVWEWTEDCWHPTYEGAPGDATAWVERGCPRRVIRGGDANDPAASLRAASRNQGTVRARSPTLGFRVAKTVP